MELRQGSDGLSEERWVNADDAVVATAGGGERVLRLLSTRPRRIAAFDSNRAQLHLLDLKLAAAKALSYLDYLELMGNRSSTRRRALYHRVRWLLPKEVDEFWLGNLGVIDRGVSQQGAIERQLSSFRRLVRFVHGARKLERFQALSTEAERREMYAQEWQSCLWRRLGQTLWRRYFGVGPDRLERLLLEGRLLAPSPSLTEAQFETAKELANRVLVVPESPLDYLRSLPAASVEVFLLGRIDLLALEAELRRVARPGARLSFLADRIDWPLPHGFVAQGAPQEAGFFPGHCVTAMLPG